MDTATIIRRINYIYKVNRNRAKPMLAYVEKVKTLMDQAYHFQLGDCLEDLRNTKAEINQEIKLPFPVCLISCEPPAGATDQSAKTSILMELEYAERFFGIECTQIRSFSARSDIVILPLVNVSEQLIIPFGALAVLPLESNEAMESRGTDILPTDVIDFPTVELFIYYGKVDGDFVFAGDIAIDRYFLKLLTCKNIEVREGSAKPVPRLLRKKGDPKIQEKDIVIKLPGKGIRYENRDVKEIRFQDIKKFGMTGQRRGHFKTFTEDAPLFGKHTGTWWWSPTFGTHKRNYQVEFEK